MIKIKGQTEARIMWVILLQKLVLYKQLLFKRFSLPMQRTGICASKNNGHNSQKATCNVLFPFIQTATIFDSKTAHKTYTTT
jgi:hypothetical protein